VKVGDNGALGIVDDAAPTAGPQTNSTTTKYTIAVEITSLKYPVYRISRMLALLVHVITFLQTAV
jgi:hypothetical protein